MGENVAVRYGNGIVRYFRETWAELNKVRWPTLKEAATLTGVVVAVMAAMAALLGLMDLIFSTGLRYIIDGNPLAIAIGAIVLLGLMLVLGFALRQEAS